MFDIFISYRRDDSRADAGRLYDRLSGHFGDDHVFMDIDDIAPGQNFPNVLSKTLEHCDAMLVVIGKHWLGEPDDSGQRRLDNAEDMVRVEIRRAIERGIHLVPILVGGAKIPSESDLPEDLAVLSRHQAHEVSDTRFHQDVDELIATLSVQGTGTTHDDPRVKNRAGIFRVAALTATTAAAALGANVWYQDRHAEQSVAVQVGIGDEYVAADNYRAASKAYRSALDLDPNNELTYRKLIVATRTALLEDAYGDQYGNRFGLGGGTAPVLLIDEEDRTAAIHDIYALRTLDPSLKDDVDLLLDEALLIKVNVTQAQTAIPILERAHALDPSRTDVLAELGLLRAMLKDEAQGVKNIRDAINQAPTEARWPYYLGIALGERNRCPYVAKETSSNNAPQACAEAIRAYHQAYDLVVGEDFWSRHVRYFSIVDAMEIFHRYAGEDDGLLTDQLDMPLAERIAKLEFLLPLEKNRSRRGTFDYPEYWLANLYLATGKPDAAATVMKKLLKDEGERAVVWLELYEKILLAQDSDTAELERVRTLLQQAS